MKKSVYRIILVLLVCMTIISAFVTVVSAADVETASEVIESATTEASTESSDSFSWSDIWNTFRDMWKFVVENRTTILSGLATAVSSLAAILVSKVFKPTVKSLDKAYKQLAENARARIDETANIVNAYAKKVDAMLDDYARMKEDKHTSDAFAQICHEQSLLLHKVIVQSSLSSSIKEEADRIFAESEKAIGDVINNGTKGGECIEG